MPTPTVKQYNFRVKIGEKFKVYVLLRAEDKNMMFFVEQQLAIDPKSPFAVTKTDNSQMATLRMI